MKILYLRVLALGMSLLLTLGLVSCNVSNGGGETEPDTTESLLITPPTEAPTEAPTEDPTEESTEESKPDPVKHEIKNIIIIIGDGMGIEHISAGEMAYGKDYNFTNWQFTSSNTDSVNASGYGPVLTDSAAGGTALATGYLTVNGYVGKDHTGKDVKTILDYAREAGKSTGVVTTDTIYGATPGSFSGHSISRGNTAEIVASQLTSKVDLLCGANDSYVASQKDAIERANYFYCDNFADIEESYGENKVYWMFDLAGRSATYHLSDVTPYALEYLDDDPDGFVLMMEQAYIDKYSHSNDFDGMVKSMNDLNDTVEAILEWLGDRTDTAILITADHETGGVNVSAEKQLSYSYTANGNKVYYNFSSTGHTNSKVGVFVYGFEADFSKFDYYESQHLIKNINVFDQMLDLLQNPDDYAWYS
ncbi:MAG: alkaline phosphatase [Clostridia bacterium]|nr:alkaline phosphatase [Clostridia bacterium]